MLSIYQEFKKIAHKHPRRPAVFWKKDRHWYGYNYKKFHRLVDNLAVSLEEMGCKAGDRAAIMSENRPKWLMCDLALNKIQAVSVPIHVTSNKPLIEFILNDSGSGFLFVSKNYWPKIKGLEMINKIKIIFLDAREAGLPEDAVFMDDIIRRKKSPIRDGADYQEQQQDVSQNAATIIYTSGTTGQPKGVVLTNANFIANVRAVGKRNPISHKDIFLSFLPLSHVLERTAGSYVPILNGAAIAYAESIKTLSRNLKEIKPTVLVCVPKIFENIHEKIFAAMQNKSVLIKKLFFYSLKKKKNSISALAAEKIMYSKLRKVFGGRLRLAVSGGASINMRIVRFFRHIGVNIIEGYGLTETSPIIAVNTVNVYKFGTVGQIVPGVEVRIAPDKEIEVRGPNVARGYWNLPILNQETFRDGWFKTGDLGFLDQEGFLTIIGRKKEMIVTSNGKNISPEKVESVINLSPYIYQSLVVGHKQQCLAALLVPDRGMIQDKFGDKVPDLRPLLQEEIEKINQELMPHEAIRKFTILEDPFDVEADELTPTLKIKRSVIESRNEKIIKGLFN